MKDTKKIELTIVNIPEIYLNGVWEDAIKLAKNEMGFKLEWAEEIEIDFDVILQAKENVLSLLIAAIIAAYGIQLLHNKYNLSAQP